MERQIHRETKIWGHLLLLSQEHQQETWLEVEQPALEWAPTWDADTADRSIKDCAIAPMPTFKLLNIIKNLIIYTVAQIMYMRISLIPCFLYEKRISAFIWHCSISYKGQGAMHSSTFSFFFFVMVELEGNPRICLDGVIS